MLKDTAVNERINFLVLIAGIIMLIALYPHKQLNYDEPFSIMCSKGITNRTIINLKSTGSISSAEISAQNTYHNVFQGGDSYYYVGLHYFSGVFGNTLKTYVAYSLMWSILALGAFYALCSVVMGKTLYKSLALALFATDIQVTSTTYLIRPYSMTLCLVIVSGIFLFRYLQQGKKSTDLLGLSLFTAFAILCHYLTFYIAAAYVVILLYADGLKLFSKKNIAAILTPVAVLALYFIMHRAVATSYNTYQSYVKDGLHIKMHVGLGDALSNAARSVAINFRAIYPMLKDTALVRAAAFMLVVAVYVYSIAQLAKTREERSKYNRLFLVGIIGSVILGVMSLAMNNIMLFNFRYFIFGLPFCCVFITLFLRDLAQSTSAKLAVKVAFFVSILAPGLYRITKKGFENEGIPCNHMEAAAQVVKTGSHKLKVPGLMDAVFINCFLPADYQLTYELDPQTTNFIVYTAGTQQQIPVINPNLLALY